MTGVRWVSSAGIERPIPELAPDIRLPWWAGLAMDIALWLLRLADLGVPRGRTASVSRARRIAAVVAAVLLLAFLALPVFAEQPLPPGPAAAEEPGFTLQVITWGEAAATGDADTLTYGGRLSTDGPVAGAPGLRVRVDLDLTSAPGEAFDVTDVATFGRAADLAIGLTYRLARADGLTTSLYAGAGFVTSFADQVPDRYLRRFELGFEGTVQLGESRARLRVGYCRSEEAGYIGTGQLCVAGEVPLGDKGLVLGGDALVNMSRATVSPQRDVVRVYVGADLSRLYRVIAGS